MTKDRIVMIEATKGIRVAATEYGGKARLDLRLGFMGADGWKNSKVGLIVPISDGPELAEAIIEVLKEFENAAVRPGA